MSNPDRLFELISTLTRGEKINFKKFARKHIIGDCNNYVKLFDFINKKTGNGRYYESEVKEHFKDEKFVKNFPVMKSYLYENILKSLSLAQNNDSQALFKHAVILYSKGLNSQVPVAVKRAKQNAIENEDFNVLLGILDLEYNFVLKFNVNRQREKLESVLKEKDEIIKKIINLNKYLFYQLETSYYRSKEAVIRTETEKKRVKKLIQSFPMLTRDCSLSKRAKFLYYIIKSMTFYNIGDYPTAYKYFEAQLFLIESTPFLRKNVANHILILYDVAYIALVLRKFEDLPVLLNKLENLVSLKIGGLTKLERLNSLFFYYLIKLDTVLITADFENRTSVFNDVENFINTYSLKEYSDFPYLIITLSTVYFAMGNYEKSLYWVNKFSNEKEYKSFTDLTLGAKILSIFIHYELNNIELLQYMVKSLYHFLLKSKKNLKFEMFLIRFIRKLSKVNSNEDFILILKTFRKELKSLEKDPFELRVFLEYFDYIAWIDSKIENIPVAEALKKRMMH